MRKQLTRYQYHFVIGRKGQTLKFTVSFDPSDFHHLAGLHKLKDNVRLQTGQRSTIFRDVLDGKYPFEQIKHSAYFREMEQRLTPLAHLEEFLDSNEIIFRYNEKANRFSAIRADYLLLNERDTCISIIFSFSFADLFNHSVNPIRCFGPFCKERRLFIFIQPAGKHPYGFFVHMFFPQGL